MKRLKRKNYLEKIPEGAKLVSRPSRWGNPNSLKDIPDIEQNLDVYTYWLRNKLEENPKFLDPLIGFDLVCYCDLDKPCHADIILDFMQTWLKIEGVEITNGIY